MYAAATPAGGHGLPPVAPLPRGQVPRLRLTSGGLHRPFRARRQRHAHHQGTPRCSTVPPAPSPRKSRPFSAACDADPARTSCFESCWSRAVSVAVTVTVAAPSATVRHRHRAAENRNRRHRPYRGGSLHRSAHSSAGSRNERSPNLYPQPPVRRRRPSAEAACPPGSRGPFRATVTANACIAVPVTAASVTRAAGRVVERPRAWPGSVGALLWAAAPAAKPAQRATATSSGDDVLRPRQGTSHVGGNPWHEAACSFERGRPPGNATGYRIPHYPTQGESGRRNTGAAAGRALQDRCSGASERIVRDLGSTGC